jgi:ABC-type branched-subunit amino acid transport system ATPase component
MLELENVSVRFGGLTAVDSVTLKVGSHDVVGLVGANGAGKTTLFNAISGLVRPTGGSIRFEGAISWPRPCTSARAWDWAAPSRFRNPCMN